MVKLRVLGGEARGKGFGLLATEPTFDLLLSFSVFYGGPNPRLYSSD